MTTMKKSSVPSLLTDRLLNEFFDTNRFFDSDWLKLATAPAMPAVNIKETEHEFMLELAAPGMTKNDFEVTIDNGILTIGAEKEIEKEERKLNYTRREFSFANFKRSFTLPENVNEEKIVANYEDGILKLHLNKKTVTKMLPKKEIMVS